MNNYSSGKSKNMAIDKWASWLLHQRFQGRSPDERKKAIELLENIRDRILDNAQLHSGQQVLDLGSGTGLLALGAMTRILSGGSVLATDISIDSLSACRQNTIQLEHLPIHYVAANGLALPFQTGVFDAIVIRSVLIYVTNKIQMLSDCYRVLCAGGKLSLCEPINRDRTHNVDLSNLPNWMLKRINQEKQDLPVRDNPMIDFGIQDLRQFVTDLGFTNIKINKDIVEEALLDLQAVDAYFNRVPAPDRLSPKEYYMSCLGDSGFRIYRQCWIDALTNGPIFFQTPIVFLTALKAT